MLSIAAAMLDPSAVTSFDIDPHALEVAQHNAEEMEVEEVIDFVHCDIESVAPARRGPVADTVIMNPPFGCRRKGIDMCFLQRGVQMARTAVYSLHKTSTRQHILQQAAQWGCEAEVIAELKFDIPAMYKFHKKKSVDVEVDLIRLDVSGEGVLRIWDMPACETDLSAEEALEGVSKGGKGKGGKGRGNNSKGSKAGGKKKAR
eukprot:TRINITY_DN23366_c0_g1_i1.p1 TRINITY_DN23366_c0_g1~~TRINITY_DN23366_c0_g1_i1.p1  ORF type:complete len:203 (+),score=56.27 TRINITY_DN23366_c0_g1_i1:148-756(+)